MNNKYYLDIVFRKEKLSDGSDVFVSNCPSLGLASQGDNIEESLDMVKEAIQLYLEDIDNLEEQLEIISDSIPFFTIIEIVAKEGKIHFK